MAGCQVCPPHHINQTKTLVAYASSLWKPLKGPLNDWPLGLCDTRSVDFPRDTLASDVVFDGFVTENLQIMHSPKYKWYYLPDHNTWEALIFKSADSEEGKGAAPGKIYAIETLILTIIDTV